MQTMSGKVVVITGAARGLGRDYTRYFSRDGAHVVLADVKDTRAAAEQASAEGSRCNAVKRLGTSRDLYQAMAYLCSDQASWVTGQTLRVDGSADIH